MNRTRVFGALGALALVVAACSPSAQEPTPASEGSTPPATVTVPSPTPGGGAISSPSPTQTATPRPTPQPTISAAASPQYGGVFRTNWNYEASPLDPWMTSVVSEATYLAINYGRLLDFHQGPPNCQLYPLTPELAESWRWVDDRTLEVKLTPGIRFQNVPPLNGRELVASDVVYSLQRTVQESPQFQSLGDNTEKMEAVDQYTTRIRLKRPQADYAQALLPGHTAVVLPPEIGSARRPLTFDNHKGVGYGAFLLESYLPGVKVTTLKNPTFFKAGLPYLAGMTFYMIPEQSTALASFRAGRLDAVDLTENQPYLESLKVSGAQGTDCAAMGGPYLHMRTDSPPFNDVRVRHAISMAIDRESLGKTVFAGLGSIGYSVFHAAYGDWRLPLEKYPQNLQELFTYNPTQARKLLAEAGYPKGFSTSIMTSAGDPVHLKTAEFWSIALNGIGIQARLDVRPKPEFLKLTTGGGEYGDMSVSWHGSRSVDEALFQYFFRGSIRNTSRVNDPELERMIEKQSAETDSAKRKALVHDIELYLAGKMYRVPSWLASRHATWQPYVKNVFWSYNGYLPPANFRWVWLDK